MRIDGKEIAQSLLGKLKDRVEELKKKNVTAHLAIILVGNDPASLAYVRQKELKGEQIGAKVSVKRLPEDISQKELLLTIQQFNNDNNIHGIIVQRPLPKQIDSQTINNAVDAQKDIDAFRKDSLYQMPLAKAVLYILEHISKIKAGDARGGAPDSAHLAAERSEGQGALAGRKRVAGPAFSSWLKSKSVIVIGKGETGGGPTIALLRKSGVEPSVIDSKTVNPNEILKDADIVVSAIGKSHRLNPHSLKKGVILISVGMHRGQNDRLHGDFEEEKIKNIASYYTPIPGGIGPVNVAMLLQNLIQAAES